LPNYHLVHNAADSLDRYHHQASVRGGGDDLYGLPPATKLLTIQRWSILWRSIIASALDATLFPYCRYIRNLDFRDLGNLLDEDQFRNKVFKSGDHFHSKSHPKLIGIAGSSLRAL